MIDNGRKRIIPNEVLLPEVARLISEGHTVTLTVRGNSMNPFLVDRRDRIILGPLPMIIYNRALPYLPEIRTDVLSSTASSTATAKS